MWSRAVALAYLFFILGTVFAQVGQVLPAREAYTVNWWDALQIAIIFTSAMTVAFMAGLEGKKWI